MSTKRVSVFTLSVLIVVLQVKHNSASQQPINFTLIGSYKVPISYTTGTKDLFVSNSAAAFEKALDDCKSLFGKTASLLMAEEPDELEQLKDLLETMPDTTIKYWIGARYYSSGYKWLNGKRVDPSFWADQSSNLADATSRVFINVEEYPYKLYTAHNTFLNRFICQIVH